MDTIVSRLERVEPHHGFQGTHLRFLAQPQLFTISSVSYSVVYCYVCSQITKFVLKNYLNAATDLQRIQRLLLGDNRPFLKIRQYPRMSQYINTFRRMEAVANRR